MEPTTTEPFLSITVVWEITYIDYPICLDRWHTIITAAKAGPIEG